MFMTGVLCTVCGAQVYLLLGLRALVGDFSLDEARDTVVWETEKSATLSDRQKRFLHERNGKSVANLCFDLF